MHYQTLSDLLQDLKTVTGKYNEEEKKAIVEKFNYFQVVSEKYHYENFHSDVIAFLLNCGEKHRQGNLFIREFIELLKKYNPSISGFNNVKVFREHGRIDILLRDEENKKSIIIENKINNAIDQEDQLTRYYHHEIEHDYDTVSIFYLSLNGDKTPPIAKAEVQSKIKLLAAFGGTEIDLYKGWLLKCLPKIADQDVDVKSFVNQYAQLYRIMSKELVDNKLTGEFFDIISASQEKYETVITAAKMVNDLQPYIMYRLAERYKLACAPVFKEIIPYPGEDQEKGMYWVVMHKSFLSEQGFSLILELWIKTLNCIEIHLFSREELTEENRSVLDMINTIKIFNMQFKDNSRTNHYGYSKEFIFPEQQADMDKLITGICEDLQQLKVKTHSL